MYQINRENCLINAHQYDRLFQSYIDTEITPCLSVTVVNKGNLIYQFNAGFNTLSTENRFPIDAETGFNIGSVTKMVTAALLVKLIELGKLSLQDQVQKFIPEFGFNNVQIHHLLTHTSGIHKVGFERPKHGLIRKHLDDIYANREIDAAPGEQSLYYSTCFTILMDIIERVSGHALEEFARVHLFDPLGMSHTTFDTRTLIAGKFTLPCRIGNVEFEDKHAQLDATGDSGLYSTGADLVKFGELLLSNGAVEGEQVFSAPSIDYMHREITGGRFARTPIAMLRTDHDIHGCFGDLNSPTAIGHPGFSGCMLMVDPQYSVTAAIVTNSQKLHQDWGNYKSMNSMVMAMRG